MLYRKKSSTTILPFLGQVSHYVKAARVKQVLADLALSQVAGKTVEELTQSEYRR